MSNMFEIHAQSRSELGKAASRRMRHTDSIPAIIYGGDAEPQPLTLDHNKVIKALENEAFYSHILTVNIDGKPHQAILRDIQRHPYKPKVMHMDFQRISSKDKIHMTVPLHFKGEDTAPGVKDHGGIISHLENSVEISCLASNLPEYLEIDLSNLKLDESLHLSDIKLPKGIELVALNHENDLPVVSIHLPRAAFEEEEEAETPETEVINQKSEAEGAEDEQENKE